METRTLINRLLAFVVFMGFFAYAGHGLAPPPESRAPLTVKALLLVDEVYGASLNIEDNQNSILEYFADYGWEVSIACCTPEVNPCPWAGMQGCEVINPDLMTYELDNALEWDVIVVVPGGSHANLLNCPFVLSVLAQANSNNIPIAAWCRGVRVLAAANVLEGIEITGHDDYIDAYQAAGAVYLGNFEPPTEDQGIITCVNATEYRQEMCAMIRDAVESSTYVKENMNKRRDKIEFKLCPNPIKTPSCIQFDLDQNATVHIAVFNQQGTMVMDVVKQQFLQGMHRVTFSPAALPTGIYYVYLFCEGRMGMQKCMII